MSSTSVTLSQFETLLTGLDLIGYLQSIKTIAQSPVSDEDIVVSILNGLNDDFKAIYSPQSQGNSNNI